MAGEARPGSYLVVCDDSGFVAHVEDTVLLWDGRRVLRRFADVRNPQDFPVKPQNSQAVPDPRPPPTDDEGSPTRTQPSDL